MVLVWLSWSALDYFGGPALEYASFKLEEVLQRYIRYSPPHSTLLASSICGLMCWFQPFALRLGLIRGALWVISFTVLAMAVISLQPRMFRFGFDFMWILLGGQFCGLPGLVAIGARTRAWLTLVGGALAIVILILIRADQASTSAAFLLGNLPYAAVMIYGTRRINRASQTGTDAESENA
jgi:hypothetical protein